MNPERSNRPPRRALVLTGGAARGAFLTGVVDGLVDDAGLDFEVVAGVSVGALIAANLAQAPVEEDPDESRQRLRAQNQVLIETVRSHLPSHPLLRYWPVWGKRRRRVVRSIVESTIDLDRIASSGRRFLGGAVDLWTGKWRLRDESNLASTDELVGMMSLPLLDPPVHVGRELWVDGVLRRTAPIEEVLVEGVDELFIVAAGSAPLGPTLRARGAFRALAIALGELAYDKEIRLALLAERQLGTPRVTLIRPESSLNGHLTLSPDDFEFALSHGRTMALSSLQPGCGGPLIAQPEDRLPEEVVEAIEEKRTARAL